MARTSIEPDEDIASFLADPQNGETREEREKLFNKLAARLNDCIIRRRMRVFDTPTPAGQLEAAANALHQDIISRLSDSSPHNVRPRERYLSLPDTYPSDVVEKVRERFVAAGYQVTYGPCQAGGTAGHIYDWVTVTLPEDWMERLLSMSFRLPRRG
jgi:hypothetical protein